MWSRRLRWGACALVALVVVPGVAAAHGGGLASARPERTTVPTWLFLLTGGTVVGVSFLLASFLTDRPFLERVHRWRRSLPAPTAALAWTGRGVGLAGLAVILVVGALGPREPLRNAAILLVWAGWWAGYTMSVYLVGNSWPAVDPVRTLARPLGGGVVDYPDRLGTWPAAVGVLALVWLELVSPIAEDPRALAAAVGAYLLVALGGAALVGPGTWFGRVDPVSNVFRQYGKVAPVQRTADGLALRLPGTRLVTDPPADVSEVGVVVALVWATTYDGLIQTPAWAGAADAAVGAGVPPAALYTLALGGGYLAFLGVYWLAAGYTRSFAPTYRSRTALACLFAPSLLAIAAGYHLAHYLSYFLTLSPALFGALLAPLSAPAPSALALPGWVGALSIAFVLLGHLLAIWVAHSVAFEAFPHRLQAIRSQYAITAVMVFYTMASLWIVTQPFSEPPHL